MGYVIVSALSLAAGFSLAAATLRPRGPRPRRGGYVRLTASSLGNPVGTGTTGATSPADSSFWIRPGPPSGGTGAPLTLAPPSSDGGPTVYGNATGGNPGPRPVERADYVEMLRFSAEVDEYIRRKRRTEGAA